MKQRVREAAFNLLGKRVTDTHVLDLFAGTGALTWEALSRGAVSATLVERHFPSARLIRQNAADLGLTDRVRIVAGDTFHWGRQMMQKGDEMPVAHPWLVFCCPPYELYVAQWDDMLQLIETIAEAAPPRSVMVVESDGRVAPGQLPSNLAWDRREYPPAVLSLAEKVVSPDQSGGFEAD
jgi:16S rRNA (guanine966-N2)-methyltransferase